MLLNNDYRVTKHVSHTNSSFQLNIVQDSDVGSSGSWGASGASGGIKNHLVKMKLGAVGFFQVIGPGDLAFYTLISECTNRWYSAASFDCR